MEKLSYMNAAQEWLEVKKISIKYSTYVKYEMIVKRQVNAYFASYTIDEINQDLIVRFFQGLINDHQYANSTLLIIRYIVKAVNQYIQAKYNTAYCNMELIKISRKTNAVTILTSEQTSNLSNHCFTYYQPICIAVVIGLYAGLRIGEICALKWTDINFEEGYIVVYKTIERLKATDDSKQKTILMSLSPKTESSNRIVPIPGFVLAYIKEYKENITVQSNSHYILTNDEKIPDPRTTQYRYKKLCKTFDFTINFHSLRHSYATNCIMLEIDTKSLSEILGHSTVQTTLSLYVHSSLEFKKQQIDKISKL